MASRCGGKAESPSGTHPLASPTRSGAGPTVEWDHAHIFEDRDGGTFVHDIVRYHLIGPNLLTRPVNALLVAPDTRRIFTFRHAALERSLGLEGQTRSGPVSIERGHL